jgi:hypothetical protein
MRFAGGCRVLSRLPASETTRDTARSETFRCSTRTRLKWRVKSCSTIRPRGRRPRSRTLPRSRRRHPRRNPPPQRFPDDLRAQLRALGVVQLVDCDAERPRTTGHAMEDTMGKHDTSSLSGDLEPGRAIPLGNPLRSSGSEAPPSPEEAKLACRASQERRRRSLAISAIATAD